MRDLAYPFPGQPQYNTIYTDDATRKLSDGVRRRCFNCCTTDTSTWRRSSLNLGKVLCNKCGLFERTHSRPRPAQFPHKRGPLATSNLKARASPTLPHAAPPPPYQSTHPSIAPLRARTEHGGTLPQIHSWIDAPAPPTARSPDGGQPRYTGAVAYRPQSP
ncbi:hypothetical protein BV25DRAFT_1807780 [Artomyces pyxidatus]|uniref:Uncharacterized protein n=1 Tax=Artomyces pyxidatus TaxID=48021 RepID=A0ACB8SUX7_9AGAM|nr:hypothetical protein BV25DRAFT_1807780 [Artomyces pyxidatus]